VAHESTPLLWHFPISHFNEKVRWALDYKAIPHRRQALGVTYVSRAWFATRQAKLPILFLNGKPIWDSTRILETLELAKPEPHLYPKRGGERARAVQLERYLDEQLGDAVRAVIVGPAFSDEPFGAIRVLSTGMNAGSRWAMRLGLPFFRAYYNRRHDINTKTVAEGRDKISRVLDRLRTEIQPSGYLVGEQFSIADLTAAALLSPLAGPTELEYAPPEPLPRSFERLREELSGDPMLGWVRQVYKRHRGRSAEVSALLWQ
jgi:glutathione S-transferase